MPGPGNSSYRNLYYSFDWGPIHYVIMSTETDFLEGSPQYEWIEVSVVWVDCMLSVSSPSCIFYAGGFSKCRQGSSALDSIHGTQTNVYEL